MSPFSATSGSGDKSSLRLNSWVSSGDHKQTWWESQGSQNPPLDFAATGDSEGTSGGRSPMDSARSSGSLGPKSAEADPDLMSRDPTLLALMQRLEEPGHIAESRHLLKQVTRYLEYHDGDYPAAKISNDCGPYKWKL